MAKTLIGKQMPGRIEKVEAAPYEYVVKETGEVITLSHTYVHCDEGVMLRLDHVCSYATQEPQILIFK